MQQAQALDVLEAVLNASGHPDIDEVGRYGQDVAPGDQSPAGVSVLWRYGGGATSYLSGSLLKVETPLPTPASIPAPQPVGDRLPVFVVQLLDVARPDAFRSWELVALTGIGPTGRQGQVPDGVRITGSDGTTIVFHATYGSGQAKEPDVDPHPGYVIPVERVQSWRASQPADRP
jgi:hypothetical protein